MQLRNRESLTTKFKDFEQLFLEEDFDHSDVIGSHRNKKGKILSCHFESKKQSSGNGNGTSTSKRKTPKKPSNYITRQHLLESNKTMKIDLEAANDKIAEQKKEIERLTRKITRLNDQLSVAKVVVSKQSKITSRKSSNKGQKRKRSFNVNSSTSKVMRMETNDCDDVVENEQVDDDEMNASTSYKIVDIANILKNGNNNTSQRNNSFYQQIQENLNNIDEFDMDTNEVTVSAENTIDTEETYSSDDSMIIDFDNTLTHHKNISTNARFDHRNTTKEVQNMNKFGFHSYGFILKKEALRENADY